MKNSYIRLRIADLVWEIRFADHPGSANFDRFCAFCDGDDSPPDVVVRIHHGEAPEQDDRHRCLIFECNDRWRLFTNGTGYSLEVRDGPPDGEKVLGRLALFDKELRTVDVYVVSSYPHSMSANSLPENPLEIPIAELLAVLLLSRGRGVLIHACGINSDGKGYLFAGNSGQGKSTMAKQWKGRGTILNDDRVAIRKKDGRYWIYGTPWHGEISAVSPKGIPLHKAFLLRHGEENRIQTITVGAAVSQLVARCFPPLWDEDGMRFTLDFLSGLALECPVRELLFLPDKRIVDLITCESSV
jgi:hypothetical protein